jgi:hypothetical protein
LRRLKQTLPYLISYPTVKKTSTRSKASHVWLPKQLSLLGTISDGELARRIGIQTSAVFLKRSSMGIAPSRPFSSLKWTPRELALLGKHSDEKVARMLKTTRKSVINKRLAMGIECHAKSSKFWHTWTDREIAMLGKQIDREVAQKIGISTMCVTMKRQQMHIPSFRKRKITNRPSRSLVDWTPAETALLGTMTDSDVAERLDLGANTVRLKRISLGIPPCGFHRRSAGVWTPKVLARLGNESSGVIARDIGVSRQRVDQKRKELGIPPLVTRKRRNPADA